MGAGEGRLGLWELCAALLGFLLWVHALSPPLRGIPVKAGKVISDMTPSYKKACEVQKKRKKNTSNI